MTHPPSDPAAEAVSALREALAEAIYAVMPIYCNNPRPKCAVWPWRLITGSQLSEALKPYYEAADALIAGPLAPLLADIAALRTRAEEAEQERIADDVRHYIQSSENGLARVPRQLLCKLEDMLRSGEIATRPTDPGDARGWLDISLAPKEMQPILLALDRGKHGDISRAPIIGYWRDRQGWTEWHHGYRAITAAVTHWRPLPEPPAASTASSDAGGAE